MSRSTWCVCGGFLLTAAVFAAGCDSDPEGRFEQSHTENLVSPVSVYTHCGVESLRIEGRWWHARPPLYDRAGSGPPDGWSDPYQTGTLTMAEPDRAVFEALGQRVTFVPAVDDQPVRICR
jgi:hypothetical protein